MVCTRECLDEGKPWKVNQFDENGEYVGYMTFFSLEPAEAEIDDEEDDAPECFEAYTFTEKGASYFDE